LPIGLALAVVGCSLPKAHDPNLVKKPQIPFVEDAPGAVPLSEGSLWQDRSTVGDLKASRLNDLVTIKIVENTTATSKAGLTTSRVGSNDYGSPGIFGGLKKLGIGGGSSSDLTTSTKNAYAGTGATDRSAVFTATVTARVVKVVSNGNLIVEGYKDIQLNNETQRLYIAGMLNPKLLDTTNSISSANVAELHIGYGGSGVVDETTKPGYVSRLLNFIWPF
jgi:flagellar L-ring protein precursor FlgH